MSTEKEFIKKIWNPNSPCIGCMKRYEEVRGIPCQCCIRNPIGYSEKIVPVQHMNDSKWNERTYGYYAADYFWGMGEESMEENKTYENTSYGKMELDSEDIHIMWQMNRETFTPCDVIGKKSGYEAFPLLYMLGILDKFGYVEKKKIEGIVYPNNLIIPGSYRLTDKGVKELVKHVGKL